MGAFPATLSPVVSALSVGLPCLLDAAAHDRVTTTILTRREVMGRADADALRDALDAAAADAATSSAASATLVDAGVALLDAVETFQAASTTAASAETAASAAVTDAAAAARSLAAAAAVDSNDMAIVAVKAADTASKAERLSAAAAVERAVVAGTEATLRLALRFERVARRVAAADKAKAMASAAALRRTQAAAVAAMVAADTPPVDKMALLSVAPSAVPTSDTSTTVAKERMVKVATPKRAMASRVPTLRDSATPPTTPCNTRVVKGLSPRCTPTNRPSSCTTRSGAVEYTPSLSPSTNKTRRRTRPPMYAGALEADAPAAASASTPSRTQHVTAMTALAADVAARGARTRRPSTAETVSVVQRFVSQRLLASAAPIDKDPYRGERRGMEEEEEVEGAIRGIGRGCVLGVMHALVGAAVEAVRLDDARAPWHLWP
ncbi:hypothetical protein BU14_0209s0009 [Porphyra umbilicalis]|uniref:Uncharacterized protein n=1 Tax=Porphyra umbilicalis TaxID=2786 RepID=A0A1X6P594_PORUM|nr:hypothetical protein BU14_0209s0009 [Porphyra umbilicalis]|eukprot:OSX76017.1 hypothetical protein BU14_0209s0009 [Porphyra umbilicalis]